ncbi:hypothetical protein L0156_23030 [bacterium]|nr:hypothetical protein [bacterium]
MNQGFVYSTDVQKVNLTQLLESFQNELDFVTLERIDDIRFEKFTANSLQNNFPIGRAFGSSIEIRWRQSEPDSFSVQVLTEKNELDLSEWPPSAEYALGKIQSLLLWGENKNKKKEDQWIAVRLPKPISYPLPGAWRVQVVAQEYIKNGIVRFLRFRELKPKGEEV